MIKYYANYNLDSVPKIIQIWQTLSNHVERKLYPHITQVTFISIHPCVTSVWTGSVHVMTRFPVATVTTQFFTLHTVRFIAAFCNGVTTYRQNKFKNWIYQNIHAHARNTLVMSKIQQNYHSTYTLFEILKSSYWWLKM